MPAGPRVPRSRRVRSGLALGFGTSLVAAMCSISAASAEPTAPAAPQAPQSHANTLGSQIGKGGTPQERANLTSKLLGSEAEGKSLQDAYNVGPLLQSGNDGSGTTVATLVSFGDKNVKQYLDDYSKKHGLPAADVDTVEPAGPVPDCAHSSSPEDCKSWGGETDLDVAMIHTLAPKAKIRVVATPSSETQGITGFPDMMKAMDWVSEHHAANALSLSLGTPEDDFDSPQQLHDLDQHFQRAAESGVSVTASSGDEGATGKRKDGGPWGKRVAGFPAASPFVTAVGGTQLTLDAQGRRSAPDELWSRSGAGVSHEYPVPAWQQAEAQLTGAQGRSFPDVSLQGVQGTSQSSPLFAAVVDLASQQAGKPLGLINPALYQLGQQGIGTVDVTKGNNSYDDVRGFSAGKGFDTASGWGTVDAAKFVPALAQKSKG